MFSCDYNGWADVPEEEREGIDAFESINGLLPATPAWVALLMEALPIQRQDFPERRAA